MKIGVSYIITYEELLTDAGEFILTGSGELILVGVRNYYPLRIPMKRVCNGYYLRWYYNGWHYWFFLPGEIIMNTEGENYRTIGTRKLIMGSGQVTLGQCQAIRTIMNTREISILTDVGWKTIRIEPGSVIVYNNQINGYEIEFTAIVGSREISSTGYSPVEDIPDGIHYDKIYITHHNHGVFTMTITGIAGESIIIDWGNGSPPETIVLTGGADVITHDYTGTTGDHTIIIDGEENIIILEADGQHITSIIIPETAINLMELILPNNELTESPFIPDTVPLIILDLQNNPLTVCEVVIGTQIWMCKNYDSNYPGSKVYNNDEANRAIYGGLYTYNQVMASGFCPAGWHVPTWAEWQTLITYLGGAGIAGGKLKEIGTAHWNIAGGTNNFGFTALGAGFYLIDTFDGLKQTNNLWYYDDETPDAIWVMQMTADSAAIWSVNMTGINIFTSVRLIKNFAAPPATFDDWFLPSKDELKEMYDELYLFGVGGFSATVYWSSTEYDALESLSLPFYSGLSSGASKNNEYYVRACRFFTSTTVYALRDIGPAGGLIFWKSGNDYLEAAPTDQSALQIWSNIVDILIGTTSDLIGTGQANTTAIIGQAGHITSAAKLCNDLIIYH